MNGINTKGVGREMTPKENQTEPEQLPEIIYRVPTEQYGYGEIHVPIRWEDFTGTESVKKVAAAILNIADAIREEAERRAKKRKQAEAEERAQAREEAIEKEREERVETIDKFIKDNPDAVAAKRKELGEEVVNDKAAAMILIKEAEMKATPPKKPHFKAKTKAASASVDVSDAPSMGDSDKTVRFYKGEYGWSFYPYRGDEADTDDVARIFDWLIEIPMEMRHRRTKRYPAISKNGKYIMCNEYEKDFLTQAAAHQGCTVEVKED